MCPPRETTIQVKPEVLDTGRPGQGSTAYVEYVGEEPSTSEDVYSRGFGHVSSDLPFRRSKAVPSTS